MKIELWHCLLNLRREIWRLLDRTLTNAKADGSQPQDQTFILTVNTDVLGGLRRELKTHIEQLQTSLMKELTEAETHLVLFPVVLLCDEMVMARLPKEQHTLWHLLQSEMFQINYGGDVFYEFADERLSKPETPPMVFEVLYYCLSSGFVGKFGFDATKIQKYRTLLAERIPGAAAPTPTDERKRKRRLKKAGEAAAPTPVELVPQRRSSLWYYAFALTLVFVVVSSVVLITNL